MTTQARTAAGTATHSPTHAPAHSPGHSSLHAATPDTVLTSRQLTLMAVAAGVSVANVYYLQPLLRPLAADFAVSPAAAGLLPTLTMVGYALGLLLIVPAADRVGVRRLGGRLNAVRTAALVVLAAAPGYPVFAAASVVLGAASVLAQILLPAAVTLSAPAATGRVTARITAGLFGGIVGARVLSGAVAGPLGWRAVYVISALLTVLLHLALRGLPEPAARTALPYRKLIGSLGPLWRQDRALRRAVTIAALGFAAFNLFWTAVTLYVTGAPHRWSPAAAGLLGLVGIAGTATVLLVGRRLDQGRGRALTMGAAAAMTLALLAAGSAGAATPVLLGAALLLDSGARVSNLANQSSALSGHPEARARLNTLYMTGYFTAGTAGSAAGALLLTHGGWPAACALGALLSASAGLLAARRP
ncbi:MFS transporter [Kitasatospora sp. NBC_01287]|uniref:MFS transporter n=1 Tax=Kitasatospora sp. NBC_01287 TaxID=2903573 RepID=UPI00224DE85F|nr:MFS transporter [Kitasatospora sp. NBC_01287]MCX4745699.1 MFS transporter [Kitasatospora sp. NBC_01287]